MVTSPPQPAQEVLAWFAGGGGPRPAYLPDLRLWYQWHRQHNSLPEGWQGFTLAEIAAALGVPAWNAVRAWAVELDGADVRRQQTAAERVITYHTEAGELTERWSLGPDGDWWQMEYPVKTVAELPAARALVAARTYRLLPERLARPVAETGDAGIVASELPMRPYSDLLHTLLGWGEGLMLLKGEGRPVLLEMLAILEDKLQALTGALATLPGAVVLAPDNLDGQYISPKTFRDHLAASYGQTAETLHIHGKRLVVHAGGPVGRLLPWLVQSGVDSVAGACGTGDVSMAEARAAAGPDLILWGGLAQDVLLSTYSQDKYETAVAQAAQSVSGDRRIILGIADHVPVDADVDRLKALATLIGRDMR
jgi:hypothetical protein